MTIREQECAHDKAVTRSLDKSHRPAYKIGYIVLLRQLGELREEGSATHEAAARNQCKFF